MGSLPNLHELSKEKLESPVYRPVPIGGLGPMRLPAQAPPLAHTHRRARSSGNHHTTTLWDNDAMLEHMAAYSPISCRSARTSAALSWRRRDSMNSSAGASSVRRLIAAVRTAPSGPRPAKKTILRHCAALLLGHATCSAAILPIFPLQAGLGAFNPQLGPILLALLYLTAAITACFAPIILQKIGTNLAIIVNHLVTTIFVGVHLYPKWYVLLPSYAILGACVSPSFLARTSHVNISASSLALVCVDPEDSDETRRDCLLRRLNRYIKLAEDAGLAIGCLIAALLVKFTDSVLPNISQSEIEDVCGAEYCPEETYFHNESLFYLPTISDNTSKMLISIWFGFAVLAMSISCAFLDSRMKEPQSTNDRISARNIFKSVKCAFQDPKLQLAAPLTLFIGLEQGFIYADFTEAYVACALGGAGTVTVSFLSLAVLQALAGATLSMLLRHIKRYFVVVVGFAFHACLLLVLVVWRPAGDDPALFHVISAAWGVCNSIWETLIYTLVLGLYPNSWQGPLSTSLFWRWLGLSLALGLHGLVCTRFRVLGLACMLLLSVVPYGWLEIRLSKRGKSLAPL